MSSSDEDRGSLARRTAMGQGARRSATMNAPVPTSSSMTAALESIGDVGAAAQGSGMSGQHQAEVANFGEAAQASSVQDTAIQTTGQAAQPSFATAATTATAEAGPAAGTTATKSGPKSGSIKQSASQPSTANTPVRNLQSCSDCRRRKIKCARVEGQEKCNNCEKRNIACVVDSNTMAGPSRSAAAAKKGGRKPGKKVQGVRRAGKKARKTQAQAQSQSKGKGPEQDVDNTDESGDSDVPDDATPAVPHPLAQGHHQLSDAEMAGPSANPAALAAAVTPAPDDLAFQDMNRGVSSFYQGYTEPAYVGSLDESFGGPPLNTAGELLDMYDAERGLATGMDDYDDDYVAPYVDLGPEPDYHLLGLPVPRRDQDGNPIIEAPAAEPEVAIGDLEMFRRPSQAPSDTAPAAQAGVLPTFGLPQSAASRPSNFGDITYPMRPAPQPTFTTSSAAVEALRHGAGPSSAGPSSAQAGKKPAAGQSQPYHHHPSGAPFTTTTTSSYNLHARPQADVHFTQETQPAAVAAPRGVTKPTTNMGPPPARAAVRAGPTTTTSQQQQQHTNTTVQGSLDVSHIMNPQHAHGPIFEPGTLPHQYSCNKLLFMIEKARSESLKAGGGDPVTTEQEKEELDGKVEAARRAAIEKWEAVNEGQGPEAAYDKEGLEYLKGCGPSPPK